MFDSWTKSKFYMKCKSLIKVTKTRLDNMKKKKYTVVKYLKNDVADLLKTGLDYNAYIRVEGLLIELDVISCYELLDQFCQCISSNLKELDKQKQCPDGVKEAVQSLVFAAARFAEFPELRDIRALFTNKFGTLSDMFVHKELAEKLKPLDATREMKLQLMREVAKESGIAWNSKSLEQKVTSPNYEEKENIGDTKLVNTKQQLDQNGNAPLKHVIFAHETSEDETASGNSSSQTASVSEDEDNRRKEDQGFFSPPYVKKSDEKETPKTSNTTKPKPRSVRSRPKMFPGGADDGVLRSIKPPPGRSANVPVLSIEDIEEEELDELLMYYSTKDSKLKEAPKLPRSSGGGSFADDPATGGVNVHARFASVLPELSTRNSHPNLPDYDDLAARLAALRAR